MVFYMSFGFRLVVIRLPKSGENPPALKKMPSKTERTSWIFLVVNVLKSSGGFCLLVMITCLGGGNSNISYFHPENWGRFPI